MTSVSPKRQPKDGYEFLSDEAYAALIAEVTRTKSDDERRFIRLGWQLIGAKFSYYIMDAPTLADHEYDSLEREYDALAKKLGVPPTASDMVGFDRTRPSCVLAADKIQGRNPPEEPSTDEA